MLIHKVYVEVASLACSGPTPHAAWRASALGQDPSASSGPRGAMAPGAWAVIAGLDCAFVIGTIVACVHAQSNLMVVI